MQVGVDFMIALEPFRTVIFALFLVANPPPRDQMINIGSHKLHIHRMGTGAPVVVIDVGIATQVESWEGFAGHIAAETSVCTYDRAGYGQSDPGPMPRDVGRLAEELNALLHGASVPGPYILVGHSLGALTMQVYAAKYPADVAGILLLDPPPLSWLLGRSYPDLRAMADQMTAEWQKTAETAGRSSSPQDQARAAFFRTIASEHSEVFGRSAKLVADITSFGDIPLVVIASGKPNPAFGKVAEEYQKYWADQSRALAQKSSNGRFVFAPDSSHDLHIDAADVVIEAIRTLISKARVP